MNERDDAARRETLAKLALTRAELRRLLDPQPLESGGNGSAADGSGHFPRSRTMKMLLSARGLGILGAIAGGLMIARPALALRLLRLLPASAVARIVITRMVTALRAKHE